MEYYPAIKVNRCESVLVRWMNQEPIYGNIYITKRKIASGNLLYDAGSSNPCSVTTKRE